MLNLDPRNQKLVRKLAGKCLERGLLCATAESCTGGLIGATLTSLPGSSAWFVGGAISYANHVKRDLLAVPETTLLRHGAVSRPVAEAMALGAVRCLSADLSVAVTGIAGPDGGSPDKPVGTVWLAWARADNRVFSRCFLFRGDRALIRARAVRAALLGLLSCAAS